MSILTLLGLLSGSLQHIEYHIPVLCQSQSDDSVPEMSPEAQDYEN
jgi:hypothetical protein